MKGSIFMLSSKSPQILLIDDDVELKTLMSSRLQHEGYALSDSPVETLQEILQVAQSECIDIVILDISFPDPKIDGFEILKALKNQNPEIQVLILSGSKTLDLIRKGRSLGCRVFLEKPCDIKTLKHEIELCLQQSKIRKSSREVQFASSKGFRKAA